jgi:hypothetical protein
MDQNWPRVWRRATERPHHCYHYTSRFAAQSIISLGQIIPGSSGRIWLTTDDYVTGAEAADRLAILSKPIEVRVRIPSGSLNRVSPTSRVNDVVIAGVVVRHGLGTEFTTMDAISVDGLAWEALDIP